MEEIKAAIIGLGRIATLLEEDTRREKPCTHAGAIAANPDCTLVGGCDTDEERRGLFAERWGVPVYANAGEMISAQSPEILVIATHPDNHYEYCRLAAAAKVQVVICEKPLADTISAARKIAALGSKVNSGPIIITNHERRYSADYIRAREILTEGKLGTLLSVRAVLYMGKNKCLLDVFWHDGTHLADAIMFLTDMTLKHRKRWGAKLTASTGTVWLEGELIQKKPAGNDEAPIPVVIEAGAGRDHFAFEMEFSCTNGRLRIGNGVFEVWESDESPYAEKFRSLKRTVDVFVGRTGYFANMVADAVSCVREPGRKPVSSAADGLRVIEYLHSVKAWR
ncbi:MAG: Gfo/Idh/MocA family oxidoreductase [Treponema sp.]|jgi:predicted dehydrogenase|nr:Gfo/Idh/MocA family oxidoreductase [Treponema sp.]